MQNKLMQFSEDAVFFIFKMLNLLLTAICIIEELKKKNILSISHSHFLYFILNKITCKVAFWRWNFLANLEKSGTFRSSSLNEKQRK